MSILDGMAWDREFREFSHSIKKITEKEIEIDNPPKDYRKLINGFDEEMGKLWFTGGYDSDKDIVSLHLNILKKNNEKLKYFLISKKEFMEYHELKNKQKN